MMMLASVLHLLLASAAGDLGTPPARRRANGTDFRRQYFSRPVRRSGAVNEAVEILTQQEAAARLAAAPARPRIYDDGPAIDGALPTCRVTHERMAAEGTFRRRASKKAPYNTTCFFFRPRYHDAPACGGPTEAWPDWGWDYTLESAVRGRCKMPDATPTRAARAFFEARPTGVKTEDRTLTVVMLGLSFLGQPYASLACLHQDLVVNGTSYHAKLTEDAPYGRTSLADIRKDGGACLGNVDRDKIRDAFPAATHPPSFPLPRQNAYRCSYDHSMIEFHEPGEPRVRVCYRYTFNMAKNLRPGSSLPCDLAWADIDIVLHAFPGEHFRELFLRRTGAPPHLSTILVSVVNVWEGHLHAQLKEAYRREGLAAPERTDMQARPDACDRRDVHFRMPGFPDLEVQAWFSLIATGLRDVVYDSTKGGAVAGCWHQPPRQKSAPWQRCQDATARQLRWSPAVSAPVTTAPVATAREVDGHDWCNNATRPPAGGDGLLAIVLAGQMHAALDGLYCAHARRARELMLRATGLRIKTVLVAWRGDLGSLTRAAVDHVLEVAHNNTARAALVQTAQKKERVEEMLYAVSAGITFAIEELRADWVMRLRIDISLSKFCLPAALDPHACYGHRNPGARKNADRTDKVCDIAMLGAAGTMRAVYAPHRWDRYVAGASPIEQLMEDRTRAHCAFRHAPVALYIVKPGDRDGARNRSAPPAQDVHLRHWDGDGRKDRLWHAGALPPDTWWCN